MSQLLTSRSRPSRAPHSGMALTIIQAAISAFDEVGFLATSISQIAEDAGISKSLVTYYFPTKSLLGAAILNLAYPGGVFMGLERQATEPLEAIFLAVDHVAKSVAQTGLAGVALKLRDEPELHYQGAPQGHFGWLTRTTDYLDEARRSGSIRDDTDIEAESRLIVAGVVGLVTLAMQTANFSFLIVDAATVTRQRINMLTMSNRVRPSRCAVLIAADAIRSA